jgi:uncharacterized membrane protein YfcA
MHERSSGQPAAVLQSARRRHAATVAAPICKAALIARAALTGKSACVVLGATLLFVLAGVLEVSGFAASIGPMFAIAAAAGISSVAGFAFSPVSQVLLAPFPIGPVQLVQTLMVCSIATQSFAIVSLWREMQWGHLPAYLAGGLAGLPIGVYLLLHLDALGFRIAIGGLLIAYGAYVILKRPVVLPPAGWAADAAIGFIGGLTGGLAAFPGAAVTIWCGMQGWDKTRQRGLYQPFILIMQIAALAAIALMAAPSRGGSSAALVGALTFIPGTLVGSWLGLRMFQRISDRGFERFTAGLLVLAGMAMIV